MDFHSLKRKELQILCKKHGIPANLKNVEMANRLTSLLVKDDKPEKQGKRGRSCLKNMSEVVIEIEDDDEKVVYNKEVKKVRFSPENQTFVFERTDPRAGRLLARKKRVSEESCKEQNPVVVSGNSKGCGSLSGVSDVVARVEEILGRRDLRRSSRRKSVVILEDEGSGEENCGELDRNLRPNGEKGNEELKRRLRPRAGMGKEGNVEVVSLLSPGVVNKENCGELEKLSGEEDLDRNLRPNGEKGKEELKRRLRPRAGMAKEENVEVVSLLTPVVENKVKRGRKSEGIVEEGGCEGVNGASDKMIDNVGNGGRVTRRQLRNREVTVEGSESGNDHDADRVAKRVKGTSDKVFDNAKNGGRVTRRQLRNKEVTVEGSERGANDDVDGVSECNNNPKKRGGTRKSLRLLDKVVIEGPECDELSNVGTKTLPESKNNKRGRRKTFIVNPQEPGEDDEIAVESKISKRGRRKTLNVKCPENVGDHHMEVKALGEGQCMDDNALENSVLRTGVLQKMTQHADMDSGAKELKNIRRSSRKAPKSKVDTPLSEHVVDSDQGRNEENTVEENHQLISTERPDSDVAESADHTVGMNTVPEYCAPAERCEENDVFRETALVEQNADKLDRATQSSPSSYIHLCPLFEDCNEADRSTQAENVEGKDQELANDGNLTPLLVEMPSSPTSLVKDAIEPVCDSAIEFTMPKNEVTLDPCSLCETQGDITKCLTESSVSEAVVLEQCHATEDSVQKEQMLDTPEEATQFSDNSSHQLSLEVRKEAEGNEEKSLECAETMSPIPSNNDCSAPPLVHNGDGREASEAHEHTLSFYNVANDYPEYVNAQVTPSVIKGTLDSASLSSVAAEDCGEEIDVFRETALAEQMADELDRATQSSPSSSSHLCALYEDCNVERSKQAENVEGKDQFLANDSSLTPLLVEKPSSPPNLVKGSIEPVYDSATEFTIPENGEVTADPCSLCETLGDMTKCLTESIVSEAVEAMSPVPSNYDRPSPPSVQNGYCSEASGVQGHTFGLHSVADEFLENVNASVTPSVIEGTPDCTFLSSAAAPDYRDAGETVCCGIVKCTLLEFKANGEQPSNFSSEHEKEMRDSGISDTKDQCKEEIGSEFTHCLGEDEIMPAGEYVNFSESRSYQSDYRKADQITNELSFSPGDLTILFGAMGAEEDNCQEKSEENLSNSANGSKLGYFTVNDTPALELAEVDFLKNESLQIGCKDVVIPAEADGSRAAYITSRERCHATEDPINLKLKSEVVETAIDVSPSRSLQLDVPCIIVEENYQLMSTKRPDVDVAESSDHTVSVNTVPEYCAPAERCEDNDVFRETALGAQKADELDRATQSPPSSSFHLCPLFDDYNEADRSTQAENVEGKDKKLANDGNLTPLLVQKSSSPTTQSSPSSSFHLCPLFEDCDEADRSTQAENVEGKDQNLANDGNLTPLLVEKPSSPTSLVKDAIDPVCHTAIEFTMLENKVIRDPCSLCETQGDMTKCLTENSVSEIVVSEQYHATEDSVQKQQMLDILEEATQFSANSSHQLSLEARKEAEGNEEKSLKCAEALSPVPSNYDCSDSPLVQNGDGREASEVQEHTLSFYNVANDYPGNVNASVTPSVIEGTPDSASLSSVAAEDCGDAGETGCCGTVKSTFLESIEVIEANGEQTSSSSSKLERKMRDSGISESKDQCKEEIGSEKQHCLGEEENAVRAKYLDSSIVDDKLQVLERDSVNFSDSRSCQSSCRKADQITHELSISPGDLAILFGAIGDEENNCLEKSKENLSSSANGCKLENLTVSDKPALEPAEVFNNFLKNESRQIGCKDEVISAEADRSTAADINSRSSKLDVEERCHATEYPINLKLKAEFVETATAVSPSHSLQLDLPCNIIESESDSESKGTTGKFFDNAREILETLGYDDRLSPSGMMYSNHGHKLQDFPFEMPAVQNDDKQDENVYNPTISTKRTPNDSSFCSIAEQATPEASEPVCCSPAKHAMTEICEAFERDNENCCSFLSASQDGMCDRQTFDSDECLLQPSKNEDATASTTQQSPSQIGDSLNVKNYIQTDAQYMGFEDDLMSVSEELNFEKLSGVEDKIVSGSANDGQSIPLQVNSLIDNGDLSSVLELMQKELHEYFQAADSSPLLPLEKTSDMLHDLCNIYSPREYDYSGNSQDRGDIKELFDWHSAPKIGPEIASADSINSMDDSIKSQKHVDSFSERILQCDSVVCKINTDESLVMRVSHSSGGTDKEAVETEGAVEEASVIICLPSIHHYVGASEDNVNSKVIEHGRSFTEEFVTDYHDTAKVEGGNGSKVDAEPDMNMTGHCMAKEQEVCKEYVDAHRNPVQKDEEVCVAINGSPACKGPHELPCLPCEADESREVDTDVLHGEPTSSEAVVEMHHDDTYAENLKALDAIENTDNNQLLAKTTKRSILIHGTPRKPLLHTHALKENILSPKRSEMVNATARRPLLNRKPLGEI